MSTQRWMCWLIGIVCLLTFNRAYGVFDNMHGELGSLVSTSGRKTLASEGGHGRCTPYPLPDGVSSYQEWCRQLSTADDRHWDKIFKNASGPPTQNAPLPLNGCVLGCLVGKDSYQRGVNWGAGAWSGKW